MGMDHVNSKIAGVSGRGPGGQGPWPRRVCHSLGHSGLGCSVGRGGARGALVRTPRRPGAREGRTFACSWGWGWHRQRPAGVVPGRGGGGARSPEPSAHPAPLDLRTQGASRAHRPYFAGTGQGLLPPPDGVWGIRGGEPRPPPRSGAWVLGGRLCPHRGDRAAGCPGRRVRGSQGGWAAALTAPSLTRAHPPL